MDHLRIIFESPLPAWVVLTVGAALLAVALWFAGRDSAHLKRRLRWLLLALRTVAIVLFILIALAPKVVIKRPDPQKPTCLILFDGSESMTFEDEYSGAAAEALKALLASANLNPTDEAKDKQKTDRQTILRHVIAKTQFLTAPSKDFRLSGAVFANGVRPISLQAAGGLPEVLIGKDSFSTNLGGALAKAAAGSGEGTQPIAVIIFSDGSWNNGPDPLGPARALGSRDIPVHAVAFGDPNPPRDIAITAVRTAKQAFLGQEINLEVDVRGVGFGARSIPLEVLLDGEVVARRDVFLAPSGQTVTASVMLIPERPGFFTYAVRTEVQAGETHEDNNLEYASVEVSEKKIGVLLVDSVPRWEHRFLVNVLVRDPAVDLKIFLARPGVGPASGGNFIEKLPDDKKQLAAFDLVILGDIDSKSLPPMFQEELADMVVKRGAGLIVMAGRRGNYRTLRGSPIEKILPVILPEHSAYIPSTTVAPQFRMELTPDGRRNLMLRLTSDAGQSEAAWANLPRFIWCADVAGLQRGATSLAIHPYWVAGAERLPLLALSRAGAGKVLFIGVEETWRWRQAVGDRYHYRLWAQIIRWMTQRRFQQEDSPVRLCVEPVDCRIGSDVAVEAYCLDKDGFPLEETAAVHLVITPAAGTPESEAQRVQLKPIPGGWGLFRTTFTPTSAGEYELQAVVDYYGSEPVGAKVPLKVTRPDIEKNFPSANRNAMSAIAEASGGKMFEFWEVDGLVPLLRAGVKERFLTSEFSMCENFAAYLIPLGLLATEWVLRKRSALA